MAIQLFFLFAVTAWTVIAAPQPAYIEQAVEIHRLRPQTGSAGHRIPQIDCLSWRLGVETNNIRDWKLVPSDCENYVGHYMLGEQYRDDCEIVADAAIEAIAYNSTKFNEWVSEAKSPAIPASLRLYNVLLSLGIRPVFLTGVREVQREARTTNLLQAGYQNWEKLILKGVNETRSGVVFKSGKRTELVNAGYRIVGNMGDQWSDLLGADAGDRTFKVPDPMYYIG
nr:acid phosphatase 1-like [Ipomoea batatas]